MKRMKYEALVVRILILTFKNFEQHKKVFHFTPAYKCWQHTYFKCQFFSSIALFQVSEFQKKT